MPNCLSGLKYFKNSINIFNRHLPLVSSTEINSELIKELIGKENPTILEIGCNNGAHTLWFLEIFRNPILYCFEPDPRAISRFKINVGERSNVRLFEVALGDRNGEIDFFQSSGQRSDEEAKQMPDGWDQSGSIRQPKEHLAVHPWVKFDRKIKVAILTLDAWIGRHGIDSIDFIWMDVQGAEIDVFRGGVDALSRTRFIYTEYSDQQLYQGQFGLRKLLKFMDGFEVVARYPGDVLLRNRKLIKKPKFSLRKTILKLIQ